MKVSILVLIYCCLSGYVLSQTWEETNKTMRTHYNQKDYAKALDFAILSVDKAREEFGELHKNFVESYNLLALINDYLNNLEAEEILLKSIEYTKALYGSEHPEYARPLYNIGKMYWRKDNLTQAEKYLFDAIAVLDKSTGIQDQYYNLFSNSLAELYSRKGKFSEAESLHLKLVKHYKKQSEADPENYAIALNNLGYFYLSHNKLDLAKPELQKAADIFRKNFGETHHYYVNTIENIAELYEKENDYAQAIEVHLELKEIYIEKNEKNSIKYGKCLNDIGLNYYKLGNIKEAERNYLEALNILENIDVPTRPDCSGYLSNLAHVYYDTGRYDKALELYFKAKDITEKNRGKENLIYGTRLINIARTYKEIGDYGRALYYCLEACNVNENSVAQSYNIYNTIAGLYEELGDYKNALVFLEKAVSLLEDKGEANQPLYGTIINNLAGAYQNLGFNDKAISLYLKSIDIAEKTIGKEHYEYGIRLGNLAGMYYRDGDYDKALPLFIKALANNKNALEPFHPEIATRLSNLAVLYADKEQYDKALPLFKEALEITANALGTSNPDYGSKLLNLAESYKDLELYDSAAPLYNKTIENIFININRNLDALPENQKYTYLNSYSYQMERCQWFLLYYAADVDSLKGSIYDIEIARKGIVLKSVMQMRQAILQSNDTNKINQYQEWVKLCEFIEDQYLLKNSLRVMNLKEIEVKANQIEVELNQIATASHHMISIGEGKWKEVQKKLKPNEVAIEFSAFRWNHDDSALYVTLVLLPNEEYPIISILGTHTELDSLLTKSENTDAAHVASLYRGVGVIMNNTVAQNNSKRLYELLWKPLEQYIPEGSTVYFAPSGLLHQISLTAIPCNDSVRLMDKYNLVQLSTTAKLVYESEFNDSVPASIALFGGIQYDADEQQLQSIAGNINLGENAVSRTLPYDLERSGQWNYLPGTLNEVNAIEAMAESKNIKAQLFSGFNAIEEQFKSLGGKNSPRIIHIATHGFFFPDPKQEKPTGFIMPEEKSVYRLSDNPLNRAGLLFAGANNAWQGKEVNEGLDDGILTAYEASNVILGNTKLVVLSACETGLGEIKGSEGVFGLQRAFKAAGAEYLLMSLWKVPDAETAEFMEHFYNLLFNGNSITHSFQQTQRFMRNKYPNDPYKWAAFVLVR